MIFNLQTQPYLWDFNGTQTLFPEKCTLIHEIVFKVQGFMGPLKPIYILLRLRFLDYRLIHFFSFHFINSWVHSFIHSLIIHSAKYVTCGTPCTAVSPLHSRYLPLHPDGSVGARRLKRSVILCAISQCHSVPWERFFLLRRKVNYLVWYTSAA